MDAKRIRRELAEKSILAPNGSRVLDVGCGVAEIVNFLPPVKYYGFDIGWAVYRCCTFSILRARAILLPRINAGDIERVAEVRYCLSNWPFASP